jgi:hypothetical protein
MEQESLHIQSIFAHAHLFEQHVEPVLVHNKWQQLPQTNQCENQFFAIFTFGNKCTEIDQNCRGKFAFELNQNL